MKIDWIEVPKIEDLARRMGIYEEKEDKEVDKEDGGFLSALKNAFSEVKSLKSEAERKKIEFVLGEVEDIHDVTIASQKAEIAFRLLIEFRNRAIQAFQEILRMQI